MVDSSLLAKTFNCGSFGSSRSFQLTYALISLKNMNTYMQCMTYTHLKCMATNNFSIWFTDIHFQSGILQPSCINIHQPSRQCLSHICKFVTDGCTYILTFHCDHKMVSVSALAIKFCDLMKPEFELCHCL